MQPPRVVNPRCEPYQVNIGGDSPYRVRRRSRYLSLVLAEYETLWRHRLAANKRQLWMTRLRALTGKTIGCYGPYRHGDVLVKLWHEFVEAQP